MVVSLSIHLLRRHVTVGLTVCTARDAGCVKTSIYHSNVGLVFRQLMSWRESHRYTTTSWHALALA